MYCSHCGSEISEESKFCRTCGAPVIGNATEVPPIPPTPTATPSSSATSAPAVAGNRNIKSIAIVVLVVVLAIVLFNGAFCSNQNNAGGGTFIVSQEPAQPTNLEEWLAINDPDRMTQWRKDTLENGGKLVLSNCEMEVSGNRINVAMFAETSSDDTGFFTDVAGTLANDAMLEAMEADWMQYISDLEQETGMGPITLHIEALYKDGAYITSADYTSSGMV